MIHVIVLAGGAGRRFGSNKLLADLNGLPLVMHTPLRLQRAGGFDVTVVTCHKEVKKLCGEAGIACLFSQLCREGLSGSVRAAARSLKDRGCEAALFCSGDQPFLTPDLLRGFYASWQTSGKGLGSCRAGDRVTNPAIFSAPYFDDLMTLEGDAGGRAVLRACESDCWFYELPYPPEAADIDLPQQLEEARKGETKR